LLTFFRRKRHVCGALSLPVARLTAPLTFFPLRENCEGSVRKER
jgi:hypothetical protein